MNVDRVLVWDGFVRVFHWSLVTSFFVTYFSSESIGWVHKGFGYLTLALVAARVVWGFIGTRHARFADFVPGPRTLVRYSWALLRRKEPHYLGHNPAGSVMILFLLCAVAVIGVSGWLLTTDEFWGNGAVESIHYWAVDVTLAAVAIHVLANLYGSVRHRENLIWSMITGYKNATPSPPAPGLSPRPKVAPSAPPPGAGAAPV